MSRKKQTAAEKENKERWLLTYADLITLLLAFFLMLYATSNQDLEKFKSLAGSLRSAFGTGSTPVGGGGGRVLDGGGSVLTAGGINTVAEFQALSQDLNAFAAAGGLGGHIGVRTAKQDLIISLSDNLLFNSAEAKLRPESLSILDRVAAELRALPNQLRVEGHTDNIPLNTAAYPSNWELSSARASEVLRYLVDSGGIGAPRIYAAAYADTRPIADNGTPEGRAQNRRADIVIIEGAAGAAAERSGGRN